MKTKYKNAHVKTQSPGTADGPLDNPVLDIFVSITSNYSPDRYGFTETSTYASVKPGVPVPRVDPAREIFGGTSRTIRWWSNKPFMFVPDYSGHWDKAGWLPRLFFPDSGRWFAVLSRPHETNGVPQRHYLQLVTRGIITVPRVGYRILALDTSWRQWSKLSINQRAELSKCLKKIFKTILSSFAVKATIIISE